MFVSCVCKTCYKWKQAITKAYWDSMPYIICFVATTESLRMTDGWTNVRTARQLHPRNLKIQPSASKSMLLITAGWNNGGEGEGRHVDKTQSQEVGVTFLSCVVPQLGSDWVRLEPKPPQYLGQRCAPALPLSSVSRFFFVSPALNIQSWLAHELRDRKTEDSDSLTCLHLSWRPLVMPGSLCPGLPRRSVDHSQKMNENLTLTAHWAQTSLFL